MDNVTQKVETSIKSHLETQGLDLEDITVVIGVGLRSNVQVINITIYHRIYDTPDGVFEYKSAVALKGLDGPDLDPLMGAVVQGYMATLNDSIIERKDNG